jgi:hypothetical protein
MAVIKAEERREVATCYIPNAFIQTKIEEKDHEGNQTIMKIKGVIVVNEGLSKSLRELHSWV